MNTIVVHFVNLHGERCKFDYALTDKQADYSDDHKRIIAERFEKDNSLYCLFVVDVTCEPIK